MVLTILQWRAYGDDEDCLSVALYNDDASTDHGFDQARRLAKREAKQHGLRYDPDAENMGDEPDDLIFINSLTYDDGEVLKANNGKKYKIRFEEVQ